MKGKLAITPTSAEAEIEASEKEVGSFLDKVMPDFVRQGGGILSDKVRFWRWQSSIDIIKKAKQIVEKSGLQPHEVPLKVLEPILSNGSLEVDADIRLKWSNLLANAATGSTQVTPSFAEILKQLNPIEVTLLDRAYSESLNETDIQKRQKLQFGKEKIRPHFGLSSEDFDIVAHNLFRLGIAQPPGSEGMTFGSARVALNTTDSFELTALGSAFIKACREPNN